MSYDEVIEALRGIDNDFARSLLKSAGQYGDLTERQFAAAVRMVEREQAKRNPKPVAAAPTLPGARVLFDRFKHANARLKFPKIRFKRGSIQFTISPAGASSANAGWLYVKADEKYLGKISPTGDFRQSRDATPAEVEAVCILFDKSDAEMTEQFVTFGHDTGSCCFCGLALTDPRSVTVGYGPVCSEHFGLPWGAK